MQLTPAQLSTLKAWVVANNSSIFDQSAVTALNANATPDYYIFRKTIDLFSVMSNGYDWTVVDNETAGQARIWDRMLYLSEKQSGISPWKTTVLMGVGEAYKGASGAVVAHRRNIVRVHFTKLATKFESLYLAAAADWNVGTNADKTGNRGLNTNPDVTALDANSEPIYSPVDLATVILSESAA